MTGPSGNVRGVSAGRMARVSLALLPVVAGALLGAVLVVNQRDRVQAQAQSAVRATAADAVVRVRTEIRTELQNAAQVDSGRLVSQAGAASAGLTAAAVIQARDSGAPVLDGGARPPVIVAPRYRGGAAPATTAERRVQIEGYRAVPLQLRDVATGVAPQDGGVVVHSPTASVVATPSAPPAGSVRFDADMNLSEFPGWGVEIWSPAPAIPGVAWLLAALCVGVGLGLGALVATLLRRYERADRRARALDAERSMITRLAAVLQGSLDLADVVPAATEQLAGHFDLAGLSLCTSSETGEHEVFSWGRRPDPAVRPEPPTTDLAPGQSFAVALARGGRLLGVLRVVAARRLGRSDLLALSTAGELIGSALANAEAFSRQQDLVEQMRSVDKMKTVFLSTASHELRTPVAAIVGFSGLLVERWDDLQSIRAHDLMERVLANGRRLQTLIDQLLDFSRLEQGLQPSDEVVDVGPAVAALLADQPELVAGHELATDLPSGEYVRCSALALDRIVGNLVGNAAKYSPAGSRITVRVGADGDAAVLTVDDEGPGVAPDERERVFSRFYRAPSAARQAGGAGIGLAIVSEYVRSLGGEVGVEQAPSGGARFRVSLPAVPAPSASLVSEPPPVLEDEGAHHVPLP